MVNDATKKVFVIGKSGFVAKQLAPYFSEQDNFELFVISAREFSRVACGKDAICIHAGECGDRSYVNNNYYYQRFLERLNQNILDSNFSKVVYLSSSVVYGDKNKAPSTETDSLEQIDFYAKLKCKNESLFNIGKNTILRLSNLYSKESFTQNNIFGDIYKQLREPSSDPVYIRNGSPVRDFLHVGDLFRALLAVISKDVSGIYNVGSGYGLSAFDLATQIVQHKFPGKQVISKNTSSTFSYQVQDITKFKNDTGWAPMYNLENLYD